MNAPNNPYGTDASRTDAEHSATGTRSGEHVTSRMAGTDHGRHDEHDRVRETSRPAERGYVGKLKTSAAATFALVFGLAALFSALTAILSPLAIVLGLIGLVLGIAGIKMSRRPGVTGKGVAIGGLLTALLGLLLGIGVLAGAAVFVNDEARLDQLQSWIDDARSNLPSGDQIVESVPGNG